MYQFRYSVSSAPSAPPTAPILLTGDVGTNLERAAKLGYQAIEIHIRHDAELDYQRVLAVCQAENMAISAVVTGKLNTEGACSLTSDIPYVAAAAESCMRQYIDMAAALHTDVILGWVKGQIPPGGEPREYMGRLARCLRRLEEYSAERDVHLNLEVINRYETNFLNTAAAMMDFFHAYDLARCRVHLDTFHMAIEESDLPQAIALCGERLGYFHVAENTRCYPGTGTIDFPAILRALRDVGYQGYISVECLPKPSGEIAAERAVRYLKKIAEQL